jgi:aarF domain-containing kinase
MRTLQVAGAVNGLLREFARNPASFQENGRLYPPRVAKRLFEAMGSTYIKLGQFIASSPTLFPKEYVLEFQSCLDNTPKIPYATIRKIIQDDLGRPITTVYAYVDPVPLATASIAQVHRAQLRNGTEVVIKVRKPGVDATLEADLGFLLVSSKIIEFLNPSLARLSFSNIVGDLRASMLDELDFTKEAQNLINFRAFLDRNYIVDATAPLPYLEASSKRVLTMEYLKGVPLVDLEGIKRYSANPEQTLITALKTWALSVAANDVFHADVHGGNLLVLEDGRIGFLDFGIVSKISERVWKAVSDLVQAFVASDYVGVADALVSGPSSPWFCFSGLHLYTHLSPPSSLPLPRPLPIARQVRMGATTSTVDKVKFGRELEAVIQKITTMQPEVTISTGPDGDGLSARLTVDERETTEVVLEIVDVAEKNGLKLPREFGLLLKQALYFDRYQKLLAPSLDPLRDSRVRDALNNEFGNGVAGGSGGARVLGKDERPPSNVIDVEVLK